MSSLYIGVYKALYEYAAQADEELSLQVDDLLYLLETSDIDDWWKVKKRVVPVSDEEVEEPEGLVPSNYIEEAQPIKVATALYDYDKQTEEEISFHEGDKFNIYDLSDPDWILVGDAATGKLFGFVPSNYIEIDVAGGNQAAVPSANGQSYPGQSPAAPSFPTNNFAPPPVHKDRLESASPQASNAPPIDSEPDLPPLPNRHEEDSYHGRPSDRTNYDSRNIVDEQEDAPPTPARPSSSNQVAPQEEVQDLDQPQHSFDGEFFTWYIDEVEGRKKRSVIFSIGKGLVILKPNTSNPKRLKLKSASSLDQQWRIKDIIDFSHEKKHLFLEFKNPTVSLELHCGSKDVCDAIVAILGDLKGVESSKSLKEVAKASQASTDSSNRKIGRLRYDFEAVSKDELGCREGDEVYIIDDSKSKDWWLCENIDTGKKGVIASTYIDIVGTSNLEKLTEMPLRRQSTKDKSTKDKWRTSKVKSLGNMGSESKESKKRRSRDERERIREKDRLQRDSHKQKFNSSDKSMPNFHRVRTWIDSSGTFKVEAEFLGCVEGKIHLHKTNGVKIAVAATKLSVEDLEYVEKVTGTSLETFKDEVNKQQLKRSKSQRASGVSSKKSATAAINDLSNSAKPTISKSETHYNKDPDYDWFEFFLSCGIDLGNCQRYTINFNKAQLDENMMEDIKPSLLRILGLREGDIIRVMKFLDNKFNRKRTSLEDGSSGGLFTEPTGMLKNNNSSSEIEKVDAKALPSPLREFPPGQSTSGKVGVEKIEDDAWAVKPAARSTEDLSKAPTPQAQTPQYTGSLQDLVNIKPLDSNKSSAESIVSKPDTAPTAPTLQPTKTGTLIQPNQQFSVQNTGSNISPQPNNTLTSAQKTGTFVPVQNTGGLIPVQPTGFAPISTQPTGFIPIQTTGFIQAQPTFGIVPLQTGTTTFQQQRTGPSAQVGASTGPPPTTFGQFQPTFVPLQTGSVTMPQTTFNQPMSLQQTGALIPNQRTGGMQPNAAPQPSFPMVSNQLTGGTNFTGMPQQQTGGASFMGTQNTGFVPQSTFGQQITGNFQAQSSFQSQPSFQPQAAPQPQTTFNNMPPFDAQSFSNPIQQQPFTGQPSPFTPSQTSFNNFNNFPQQSFNTGLQQQPSMGQLTNMFQSTSISSAPTGFPATSFGQQPHATFNQPPTSFNQPPTSFNQQPLQSQPTGAGFGNAPASIQPQQTGKRANLSAATPDNPFGF